MTFDALAYPIGSYEAVLMVRSDDPLVEIPVTMNVLPPAEAEKVYLPVIQASP